VLWGDGELGGGNGYLIVQQRFETLDNLILPGNVTFILNPLRTQPPQNLNQRNHPLHLQKPTNPSNRLGPQTDTQTPQLLDRDRSVDNPSHVPFWRGFIGVGADCCAFALELVFLEGIGLDEGPFFGGGVGEHLFYYGGGKVFEVPLILQHVSPDLRVERGDRGQKEEQGGKSVWGEGFGPLGR